MSRSRGGLETRPRSCLGRIDKRLGLGDLGFVHKSFSHICYIFLYTKCPNVASALSAFHTIEFDTVPQAFTL